MARRAALETTGILLVVLLAMLASGGLIYGAFQMVKAAWP